MDYFRSLLGQKPTPLAAFRNNPANRNESQRRRVMLNQQRAQRIINNNVKKANAAQKARWANQVSAANAARQLSEPTRKANPRFNPTLEAIAESNNNLPIPAAAPNGANQRARNAAEVALPENQNNIIKAQRKAARNEPNIWNMNEGRSFFQGPNAIAKISPAVSPAVNPSGYPLGVVSSSRKNKRFVSHNTTPGLARAQAANARKRHVRLLPNVGSNQNKIMSNRGATARLQQKLRDRGRTPVVNQQGIEAATQARKRIANAAVAALPPYPELAPLPSGPSGPSGPSSPLEVPELPGRSNLGLGPPGFLGAVPSPVPPPLPPKRSYPNNQGAAAAAAFARELNEAAAATPPAVPAAPPALPQFNGSVRGTNLERANAENQPKPRKKFFVPPIQNQSNMSEQNRQRFSAAKLKAQQEAKALIRAKALAAEIPASEQNPFASNNAAKAAAAAFAAKVRASGTPPPPPPVGFQGVYPAFGNPLPSSLLSGQANSNALQRVRNRGRQREENLLGAAEATRQNAQRRAAANAAAAHFAKEANNAAAAAAKAAAANAAANAAAAEAAGIAALPALSGNPYDTFKCTPCEANILAKIDTLLDRSKPSTLVSNALASGKKTIQSAIEATLLGLKLAMEQGTAGATAAGTAVIAAAFRTGKAVIAAGKKVDEAATNAASELLNAARIARNCVKGAAKGTNRSQKCAAAYAAVQNKLNELKMFLSPPYPPLPWPPSLTFPKINYFTLKNANNKTQFNRNVNRTRGALGRFGNRISKGLGAFGASLKNASSRASSALSRGTLSTRNYLSGRTKQRNSILRFIKRSYYNRGIKNIAPDALERWTRELVATGMSADDARTAVINVLGGLNMGPNGKVTAADGLSLSQRAAQAEANFARAASEVAALPPGAAAQSVVNSQQAPFIKSSNRARLESLLANETEPPTFQYKGTQGAPLGLQPRARVGSIPGLPLAKGGRSRKNRKNRKGSRKH